MSRLGPVVIAIGIAACEPVVSNTITIATPSGDVGPSTSEVATAVQEELSSYGLHQLTEPTNTDEL